MTGIKQQSAFAAAAHLLSYHTLDAERCINHETQMIDWATLVEKIDSGYYSYGEATIVKTALTFWNGSIEVHFAEIISQLSDEPYRLFVEAMLALRPLKYEASTIASPMEDFRWVNLSRWQAETVKAAADLVRDLAQRTDLEDPESVLDLADELVGINETWREEQHG